MVAAEHVVLASERDGTNLVLGKVVVGQQLSVIEYAHHVVPSGIGIGDGFTCQGAFAIPHPFGLHPFLHFLHDGPGFGLTLRLLTDARDRLLPKLMSGNIEIYNQDDMTENELRDILSIDESYRIERTVSTGNMDKFQEAICAFANDMPGKRQKGYLLIGVFDDGRISGLKVDDALMKKISGIRSDGNILPLPVMNTEKVETSDGDVLVVEVTPSFDTPVRYRGRTFIRIGPRKDIATTEEERILSERCAAALPTFDTRPCREAKLDDIDIELIRREYMPRAIDAKVLSKDK